MRLASRKPSEAAPARLGSIAKLPVFFDLTGKRVVVAGGSAAAAWKAEMLAAAGAHVAIYATDVGADLAALLERGAAAGSLAHHARPWSPDVMAGAALAVADAASDAEARAFRCAAQAAGVPVNTIDKPEHCQFQFGAIVNRSPVVVGISTDGAAPILGQAIRRRIETLLPPGLAAWGELAKSIRAGVARRLSPGQPRRLFWERFAERAFGSPPGDGDGSLVERLIAESEGVAGARAGRVTLVGAGPGDAELLTLKAVRALQAADVILYDDLVSHDVLELARREAKRLMVGKRGQRASCRQEDINDLMVKLAHQGRHVVRLKSGDPMIFGRAGEEIARLRQEGIAVDVVPGITSAAALAAALGISLTHRSAAHSVRFVTGHDRSGELSSDLDWRGLADPQTTLVVYMGRRTARHFAARLLQHGLPASTPAAAVSCVSRPGETRWTGSLGDLIEADLPPAIANPVVIGIGAVFAPLDAAKSPPMPCETAEPDAEATRLAG